MALNQARKFKVKNYCNIEKSAFTGRQYTGYSTDGRSWRICGKHGNWSAYANVTRQGYLSMILGLETLSEVSNELKKVKEQ
jgi:hypothetical protein